MDSTSLSDLNEDTINKILYFVPSVRQLVHFELTSIRFNTMTLSHMKLMKTVDFREPAERGRSHVTKLGDLIKHRFSDRLNRINCYTDQVFDVDELSLNHPKMFPRNMQHIRARLRSPEKDDVEDARHTSGLYEKLYRKNRAPTSSSSYLVLGPRDKIGGDREAIEACYRFVMKDTDEQLFLEDFKNVKRLTIFRFYSGSLKPDCIPLLPQMFVGLEELVLEMTEKLYLEDALDLKSVLDNMKVKISVMINRRRFPQESKAILGSYISHDYFNFGDITMLTGMKELLVDFSRAPSNYTALPNVSASLTSLKVESMTLHDSDAIAEFLKSNGGGLEKLRLSGYVYTEDQDLATENMEKLLEVIEDSCDKLNVLEISYSVKHSIYVRFLEHYLEKRGHCLKNLQITSACLTNGMVDVISRCCKKLKILYLVGIHSDDLDVEMCYEKTKTLSKLEAVTFRIKYD